MDRSFLGNLHVKVARFLGFTPKEYRRFLLRTTEGVVITVISLYMSQKLIGTMMEKIGSIKGKGKVPHLEKILRKFGRKSKVDLTSHETIIARGVSDPSNFDVNFSSIGGLNDIKKTLKYIICMQDQRYASFFKRESLVKVPRGILLYGPPGTGKTMLAKAVAAESKKVFIHINKECLTGFLVGESEKLVAAIFSLARKLSPCIVFIDEVENLLIKRSMSGGVGGGSQVYSNMLTIFLEEWDGLKANDGITLIGATNLPAHLDPAASRRFTNKFHVPLPDESTRRELINLFTQNDTLDKSFSHSTIVNATVGMSGSQIKNALEQAQQENLSNMIIECETNTEKVPTLKPLTTQMVMKFISNNQF